MSGLKVPRFGMWGLGFGVWGVAVFCVSILSQRLRDGVQEIEDNTNSTPYDPKTLLLEQCFSESKVEVQSVRFTIRHCGVPPMPSNPKLKATKPLKP